MSAAKRLLDLGGARGLWHVGPGNPYVGVSIKATWLRAWGGKPPGFSVIGVLRQTFTPNGRAMIGVVRAARPDGGFKDWNVPWSRRWLAVEELAAD